MSKVQGDLRPQEKPARKSQSLPTEPGAPLASPQLTVIIAALLTLVVIAVVLSLSGAIGTLATVVVAFTGFLGALATLVVAMNRHRRR